ncbi:hypothetical protein ABK040_007739 [Willaertia magna]
MLPIASNNIYTDSELEILRRFIYKKITKLKTKSIGCPLIDVEIHYLEGDANEPIHDYLNVLQRFIFVIFGSLIQYKVTYGFNKNYDDVMDVFVEFMFANYKFISYDDLKKENLNLINKKRLKRVTDLLAKVENPIEIGNYNKSIMQIIEKEEEYVQLAARGLLKKIVGDIIGDRIADYNALNSFLDQFNGHVNFNK